MHTYNLIRLVSMSNLPCRSVNASILIYTITSDNLCQIGTRLGSGTWCLQVCDKIMKKNFHKLTCILNAIIVTVSMLLPLLSVHCHCMFGLNWINQSLSCITAEFSILSFLLIYSVWYDGFFCHAQVNATLPYHIAENFFRENWRIW